MKLISKIMTMVAICMPIFLLIIMFLLQNSMLSGYTNSFLINQYFIYNNFDYFLIILLILSLGTVVGASFIKFKYYSIFGSLSAFIVSAFYAIQIINGYIEIVSSNNTLTDAYISASAVIVILIFIIYALFNVSNIVLSLLTNVFLIRKEKQDEK